MSFSSVPASAPLGYLGTSVATPVKKIIQTRAPSPGDAKSYDLGTIWVNQSSDTAYILTSKPNNVAVWKQIT